MKKLFPIFFLLLFLSNISCFSQLKSGAYQIVKHSSIVDGEDMFKTDKMLGTSFFLVDLQHSIISFTASDYVVAIYDIKETLETDGSTLFICTERKTKHPFKLMFKPHSSIKDAGELMIPQSEKWIEFFTILKDE